jgi:molecular chaperone HtpG
VLRAQKDAADAPELIGQFGVGFYASFMVADRVELITRRAGEETATRWESAGDGFYTISDAERDEAGTTVILHLKATDEEDGMKDYTQEYGNPRHCEAVQRFRGVPVRMRWNAPSGIATRTASPCPMRPRAHRSSKENN